MLLGLREVVTTPQLRETVGLLTTIGLLAGVLEVLMVVVAVQFVGLGTGGVGVLHSAWGAGGLAGAFVAIALLGRGRFSTAADAGALLVGLPLALLALFASPVVAVAGFVLFGVGFAIAETTGHTLVQRLASDETLARAFAVTETGTALAITLGSALAPALIWVLGVRGALVATALILPGLVLARRRALRRLDAHATVPARELQALRGLDLFAPLPLATVETLALRAVPRPMSAAEPIVVLGEVGDRFYVIAAGEVEVEIEPGVAIRRMGPGDYFGEIALLRGVPRTATVIAAGDGLLFALARDDFLSAVTDHGRSTHAAQTVADARLRAG